MTDDRWRLAVSGMEMAEKMAMGAHNRWPADLDELLGVAYAAAITAARDYREGEGKRYTSYAYRRIADELARCRRRRSIRFARTGAEMVDAPADGHPVGYMAEVRDEVDWFLGRLSARHGGIMRRLYVDGDTPHEVANSMGIHVNNIYRIRDESLAKMRRMVSATA